MSIAALFPGQNSQVIGMARDFYEHSDAAKRVLDTAEAALPGLLEIMWSGPDEELKKTANQQPALVAASAAAFAAYREAGGKQPAFAAGHSLGEYSAHVATGSLDVSSAVQLVRKRGEYMQSAVPEGVGAMAAILKTNRSHVEQVCKETAGVVEVANINSPEQTVISGETNAVANASQRLKDEKARVIPLKVSAPFHCSLMQPAAQQLEVDLGAAVFAAPAFPVVCNVTADVLTDVSLAPGLLKEQVTATVRWVETIEFLHKAGVTTFIEFGSGKVLTGLMNRILKDAEISAYAVTDMASLQEVL